MTPAQRAYCGWLRVIGWLSVATVSVVVLGGQAFADQPRGEHQPVRDLTHSSQIVDSR